MMSQSTIAPPVVELGRWAGWSPLPMSVRDAYRQAGELRERLSTVVEQAAPQPTSRLPRPVLAAKDIVVLHGSVLAVDRVSLALGHGEVAALMGRNGAGKSSLLWALQGTGTRTSGKVTVGSASGHDRDPRALDADERRRSVGLVPQTPADLLYLPTVAEECAQADKETGSAAGMCRGLLDRVVPDVPDELHPRDLSEGQRLALVLAIQLTARPQVLLLDEPTRGLDYPGKAALAGVLRELADDGMAVLLSTHDVEFVAEAADRVLVMAGGEVVADGPTASVVVSSPAYAPQVSKVLGGGWLTVDQVKEAVSR